MRLPALQKVESSHKNLFSQILSKIVGRNLNKPENRKKRYDPLHRRN
ncbi:hypothetical protein ACWV26_01360 [Rummeliibacillus sp. JY-2-4R]